MAKAAKRLLAILYARVSTDEQARSGYSLAQQLEALREHAEREGYEVLEEVSDPGQSGASLERPGMDRVRDLVSAGGVHVVLAQDRDRFSREPAYVYLLRREFEEHDAKLRALNDRSGDNSPEGELTDGILDQLAKFERAKTTERTRRGKLRKAREGKVVASKRPHYGYRFTEDRNNYAIEGEEMRVVGRIFRMVADEGMGIRGVKRVFEREKLRTPDGKYHWSQFFIRKLILDDAYMLHTAEEIEDLVLGGQLSREVASNLGGGESYGIYWYNRRRRYRKRVAENGANGRSYKWKYTTTTKPRSEWIAVPIPGCGIPRDLVERAREAIKDNVKLSQNDRRPWELSGGIARCAECGWAMKTHSVVTKKSSNHYYRCSKVHVSYAQSFCANRKCHRADRLEPLVWRHVFDMMRNPEQLRDDLDRMIELEEKNTRGEPGKEARTWAERITELAEKRARYQEMAASGLITFDELKEKLADLDESRKTAERELEALEHRGAYIEELKRNRDALLDSLVIEAPEALESLTPEERHQFYKLLKLQAHVHTDGTVEISWAGGVVCEIETSRPREARSS